MRSAPALFPMSMTLAMFLKRAKARINNPGLRRVNAFGFYCTVRVTVVVCRVVPFAPVIVIVRVPVVARRFTVTVIVDVPPPLTELGLNETVTRLPSPEADRETAPVNPPVGVTVIVECPELPRLIVSEVGDALSEYPGVVPVTVRVTVVVCTVLPAVPVTVIG